jgi:hypothetical protein
VQTSDDLVNWATRYELHPGTNQLIQIVDPASTVVPQRFYRLMGTNVADRALQFSLLSAASLAKLSFVAPPGDVVQVQASKDLLTWTTLYQLKIATNQWIEIVDPASAQLPQRFYRITPAS